MDRLASCGVALLWLLALPLARCAEHGHSQSQHEGSWGGDHYHLADATVAPAGLSGATNGSRAHSPLSHPPRPLCVRKVSTLTRHRACVLTVGGDGQELPPAVAVMLVMAAATASVLLVGCVCYSGLPVAALRRCKPRQGGWKAGPKVGPISVDPSARLYATHVDCNLLVWPVFLSRNSRRSGRGSTSRSRQRRRSSHPGATATRRRA
jgi:hypothetical protein